MSDPQPQPSRSHVGLRVVLIGVDHAFSLGPLNGLLGHCTLVGVIESVPTGTAPSASRLAAFAGRHGAPFTQMGRGLQRPVPFISSARPDLICVAGMAGLLHASEFGLPPLGAINLHPSLLPRYRGPEPFFWQAHAGDLAGGVTVHRIDAGIDTGDLLVQIPFPIRLGSWFGDIQAAAIRAGTAALVQAVQGLATGRAIPRPQNHLPCPTLTRKVLPGDNEIDWQNWPPERAWHFLRAVPYPHRAALPDAPPGGWAVGSLQRTPGVATPGTVAHDRRGAYLSHPQARIRLVPRGASVGPVRRFWRRARAVIGGR